jgi:hypothetical protein
MGFAVTRARPNPINPVGPGVAVRRLRIAPDDVVWLGTLLAGYDELVSLHDGPERGVLLLVTTPSRLVELDEVLQGLGDEVSFEVLEDGTDAPYASSASNSSRPMP